MLVHNSPIVTLITHTPNPERIIALAAKMCYSNKSFDDISKALTAKDISKSVSTIINSKHESVIEHVSFTFYIGNISRACMSQLTRHRMASYSVRSQRYVNENNFGTIIPESILNNNLAEFKSLTAAINTTYQHMIKSGIDKEDARCILPNACTTQLIMTINARSLMNLFKLRCCNRAQKEIRDVANKMRITCSRIAPTLFSKSGSDCVHCTEKDKPKECRHE